RDVGGPAVRARWQQRGRSLLEPSQQAVHKWRAAAHDGAATDPAAQARDAGGVGKHQLAEIETEQAGRDRQWRTESVEQVDTILGQAAFEAKNGGLAVAITGDAEHDGLLVATRRCKGGAAPLAPSSTGARRRANCGAGNTCDTHPRRT